MGQNMHLARYPIHWHLIGDAQGQYIRNSAIHDTYSRCVTVHGTNYLGAPGGRAGGAGAPAQPPVVLSRNGKDFPVTGETNVRTGTEIKVTTERPSLSLSVKELDSGSWVIFELPGFTTAAAGTEQSSLDALRKASATSYSARANVSAYRWQPHCRGRGNVPVWMPSSSW